MKTGQKGKRGEREGEGREEDGEETG